MSLGGYTKNSNWAIHLPIKLYSQQHKVGWKWPKVRDLSTCPSSEENGIDKKQACLFKNRSFPNPWMCRVNPTLLLPTRPGKLSPGVGRTPST